MLSFLSVNPPKDNFIASVQMYLKLLKAKVSRQTIEETLRNHPDHPSLLAISEVLNEWKIENFCVRIKPEQLMELDTPFLAHLNTNGGSLALVKTIKNRKIEWLDHKGEVRIEPIEKFLAHWQGIVLVAEINEDSGERNYKEQHAKEIIANMRAPFLLIGLSVLALSFYYVNHTSGWLFTTLLLTKLCGVIISSLLLWQSIDANNPLINRICRIGKKDGCHSVLQSKAAKLSPWLNWSEVGFIYFAGGLLSLLFTSTTTSLLQPLSFVVALYVPWSVYYQKFVIKQWCILCLSVQALLVIELVLSLRTFSNYQFPADSVTYIYTLQGFITVALFWVFLKPFLQTSHENKQIKAHLSRFKNNVGLFTTLHQKQEQMLPFGKALTPVLWGNPEASHTITMVTNPLCQPCSRVHKQLQQLIEANENVNCQIIFAANENKDEPRNIVARGILSLSPEEQMPALHDWYESKEKNTEQWQKKWHIAESAHAEAILAHHFYWCQSVPIIATPTLYLNGFKIPELYNLEDLPGILKYYPTTDFAKS